MGNSKSKDAEQKHADEIISCLQTHRNTLKGLADTVQTQKAEVERLMYDVGYIGPENEERILEGNEDKANKRICHHCTRRWQTNTNRLLGSIQNSLECQSDSTLTTFKLLCHKINRTIKEYKLDNGSSVDGRYEKKSIIYEGAPHMDDSEYRRIQKELREKIQRLEDSESRLVEENRRLLEASKSEVKRLAEIEDSLQRCCGNIETLLEEKEKMEHKLTEIELLAETNKSEKENLKRHLEYLDEHQPVSVQLFHQVKSDIVDKMIDELKSLLADYMGMKRQELQFIVCFNEADVNPELPLLVICMKASRLGTDITTALQHLKVSSNVAVLIFHHKDLHALPKQTSSRVLTGPEFKSLGGMFDIAFLAEKGIYPCDMNTNAAVAIHQFIKMKYQ